MDFERSQFGKMQLWIVEHFHLHKKVPVLMNHNIWIVCYDLLLQVPFCEDEIVQLFRVAFCRSDFLQNPYFSFLLQLVYLFIYTGTHYTAPIWLEPLQGIRLVVWFIGWNCLWIFFPTNQRTEFRIRLFIGRPTSNSRRKF